MTLNTWNMVPHLNIIERWSDIMRKPNAQLLSSWAGSASSISWNMNTPFSSSWECAGPAAQSWSQNHSAPHVLSHGWLAKIRNQQIGFQPPRRAAGLQSCRQTFMKMQQNCVNLIWHHPTLSNLGITLISCKGGACTWHKCPESCPWIQGKQEGMGQLLS